MPTDEAKLRALGDEGCLAMIGDSTNAVREGRSPSEAEVAKTLALLIRSARARVAVTTFASNIARIKAVADAARAADREVVVVGRAMERLVQVARETGYLDGVQDFRPADAYGYLPPDKVVAMCTGSQGEPRAALSRIAARRSSRGHAIARRPRDFFLAHDSRQREGRGARHQWPRRSRASRSSRTVPISSMYPAIRASPKWRTCMPGCARSIAVPVHGEQLHLAEHAKIARAAGVKDVIVCQNGDVIRLAPTPHGKVDEMASGRLYKDGRLIVPAAALALADRRKLSFSGMVSVALAIDNKGEVVDGPEFELIGIPERNAEGVAIRQSRRRCHRGRARQSAARPPARPGHGRGGAAPCCARGDRAELG